MSDTESAVVTTAEDGGAKLIGEMRDLFVDHKPHLLETKAGLKLLTVRNVPMLHVETGQSLVASEAQDKFELTIQTPEQNRKIREGVAERLAYLCAQDPDFPAKYAYLMHRFVDQGKEGEPNVLELKKWLRIL